MIVYGFVYIIGKYVNEWCLGFLFCGKNFDIKVSVILNSDEYIICFEYIVVVRKKFKIWIDVRYGFCYYVFERSCIFSYLEIMIFV